MCVEIQANVFRIINRSKVAVLVETTHSKNANNLLLGALMGWLIYLDLIRDLSIVVTAAGYLQSQRTRKLQHERARREKAMSMIWEFSRSMTPRSSAARKLVRHFNTYQIDRLDQIP